MLFMYIQKKGQGGRAGCIVVAVGETDGVSRQKKNTG